jgi:hypothetical protein
MNEMTDWFSPHIKPVRVGVYEIKYTPKGLGESYMWATWNGEKWSSGSYNLCDKWHKQFNANQEKYWRGFTEEQK